MVTELREALRKAAQNTLRRLDHDVAVASLATKPLLLHIRQNLFVPGYCVSVLRRTFAQHECGKDRMEVFRSELGHSAREYITLARLETASRLLRDTKLSVGLISQVVGYSDTPVLRMAFKRYFGLRPQEFRELALRVPSWPEEELLSVGLCRRLQFGALDAYRGKRLISWLQRLYAQPEAQNKSRCHAPMPIHGGKQDFEQSLAAELWKELANDTPDIQRSIIWHDIRFSSPALFHLMGEKILEVGRIDRHRGIEIAELSLDLLEANVGAFGGICIDLRALGWARLANARRLAQDFIGAEEAFGRATEEWERPRVNKNHGVEAEICDLKASLRMFQRRFEEAQALLSHSIGLCREHEHSKVLVRSLIQRAKIFDFQCKHSSAMSDLREALFLLDEHENPRLRLVAYHNLATSLTWVGKYNEVQSILPRVWSLCHSFGDQVMPHQIRWLEGLVAEGLGDQGSAEIMFKAAHSGFSELAEEHYAAAISLDLAFLCSYQGRFSSGLNFAREAVRFFDTHKINPEAVTAGRILRKAVIDKSLSTGVLRTARACRDAIWRDPTAELSVAV
ncbi:MAG: helix-turn-helix transcriptional regulator [bacterium]|nr:helix-turn-helix transcriptional regulator [bacterium]